MRTDLTKYSWVETAGKKECGVHPDCSRSGLGLDCARFWNEMQINEPGMKPERSRLAYRTLSQATADHDRIVEKARRIIANNSPTSTEIDITRFSGKQPIGEGS